jgi:hypothetical protein
MLTSRYQSPLSSSLLNEYRFFSLLNHYTLLRRKGYEGILAKAFPFSTTPHLHKNILKIRQNSKVHSDLPECDDNHVIGLQCLLGLVLVVQARYLRDRRPRDEPVSEGNINTPRQFQTFGEF